MAKYLTRQAFTLADLPEVQDFHCGDEPYEKEVADWLKGPDAPDADSALTSIKHPERPSRVWLYKLGDEIVGFGALAKTDWRWPGKNNDPKLPLSIVIWVGVQAKYWGQPPGTKEERYSVQILDDLVAEAAVEAKTHPVLGLFVHKDNKRAIKFYKDAGFSDELEQRVERTAHFKLFIVLDQEALEAAITAAQNANR
jgi:GNAT superfamily N-acetyltransferase